MTTESLMIHALKRGLLLIDFNELSIGMILDYINQYDQLHSCKDDGEEHIRKAEQKDFNAF